MPFVEYDEVQAACSDCGRQFPSEEALTAHRADSHASAPEERRPRRVACSLCDRSFPSVGALAEHNRRHHTG
jgi:C2H2-type zinc finger